MPYANNKNADQSAQSGQPLYYFKFTVVFENFIFPYSRQFDSSQVQHSRIHLHVHLRVIEETFSVVHLWHNKVFS